MGWGWRAAGWGWRGGAVGGKGIWIWIWIWRPILRLTGRLGWSTMASPTTLHIGRPCHLMHSQGPRQTLLLHPPRSRGRHPLVCCLSPLPTFLRGCSTWVAAHCSQTRPTNQGATGVLHWEPSYCSCSDRSHRATCGCSSRRAAIVMQQHFSCCFWAADTAVALQQQHVGCSSLQPIPAPLLIQGLWGCYTSSLLAAAAAAVAVMLLWLWQLSSCSCHAAAFHLPLSCCKRSSRFAIGAGVERTVG